MWAEAICRPCALIAAVTSCSRPGRSRPVHLDHRVGVGGVVVEHHARRHGHRAQPRRLPPHLADLVRQAQPAGQRLLDQHGKPRQAVRLVEGAARRVLHPEGVERHAVGQRVDARIDDGGAGHRQRAGDAAEQARDGRRRRPSPPSPRGCRARGCARSAARATPPLRGSAPRGGRGSRRRRRASSRDSRGRGNAPGPPPARPRSSAAAASRARATRTSRSGTERPPASTSATRQ